ncbi:MAG: hypothetical protein LAO30_02830 [Acidobacteriia bacterium]|nr:hypothetical protein [Terriglobia bacterium]
MLHSPARAASTSPATSNAATSSTDPGADLTSMFLQLLTAQLKSQSPLDPLDPNQFVAQLAQFESLGTLTQIQELMQTLVNDVSPTSNSSAGAGARAASNSTPSPNSSSH